MACRGGWPRSDPGPAEGGVIGCAPQPLPVGRQGLWAAPPPDRAGIPPPHAGAGVGVGLAHGQPAAGVRSGCHSRPVRQPHWPAAALREVRGPAAALDVQRRPMPPLPGLSARATAAVIHGCRDRSEAAALRTRGRDSRLWIARVAVPATGRPPGRREERAPRRRMHRPPRCRCRMPRPGLPSSPGLLWPVERRLQRLRRGRCRGRGPWEVWAQHTVAARSVVTIEPSI